MKVRYVDLPTMSPGGSVEGCAAPLKYLAWLAWPGDDQQKDRDDCYIGGMASVAKAAGVRKPEFPDPMKGRKPERVDNKVNHAFDLILRRRWRAVSMLAWRLGEDHSQEKAAARLLDWSIEVTARQGDAATRGIYVKRNADENLFTIRARVWRDSAAVLPMAYGFFHATGHMEGNGLGKDKTIQDPQWLPGAVALAEQVAGKVASMQPETRFIIPRLR